ncbi:hypothetical protein LRP67_07315 [Nocardioides sp. cx-169]|uniref:PepSY domain-containing protein n=1 Tax=Nocardioides sp. cx-169 TaxID=2899080 RepID=UPI001E2CDCD0|nr:hypothetical protein [Nocardioides sp. cx-169]MCD4533887.1 hypothetical protein [Nocardioides sp. cx-169]
MSTRPHTRRTRPSRRSRRSQVLASLAAGTLALALASCGDDDSDSDADSSASPTASAPSSSGTSSESPSAPGAADDTALLAAGATALDAVNGGTVFSVDQEAGSWDVEVVTPDGTENKLRVSADGSTVERGPSAERGDDADDRAERRTLLDDTTVDYANAIRSARGTAPAGSVTGVDLELDRGAPTWDVHLDEDTPEEQTVTVDGVTGKVKGTERDD